MFLKRFVAPFCKVFRTGTVTAPSAEECAIAQRLRELMEVTSPAVMNTPLPESGADRREA